MLPDHLMVKHLLDISLATKVTAASICWRCFESWHPASNFQNWTSTSKTSKFTPSNCIGLNWWLDLRYLMRLYYEDLPNSTVCNIIQQCCLPWRPPQSRHSFSRTGETETSLFLLQSNHFLCDNAATFNSCLLLHSALNMQKHSYMTDRSNCKAKNQSRS